MLVANEQENWSKIFWLIILHSNILDRSWSQFDFGSVRVELFFWRLLLFCHGIQIFGWDCPELRLDSNLVLAPREEGTSRYTYIHYYKKSVNFHSYWRNFFSAMFLVIQLHQFFSEMDELIWKFQKTVIDKISIRDEAV